MKMMSINCGRPHQQTELEKRIFRGPEKKWSANNERTRLPALE